MHKNMKNNLMKNSIIVVIIIISIFSCKNDQKSSYDNNKIDSAQVSISDTKDESISYLPTSTSNEIVTHVNYTLSYLEEYEQAEWVAYELKKEDIKHNDFDRPFFIEDPKVDSGSADWRNYKKSGYDKGHLCPAGDRKFSKAAFDETFYTSNISPQNHDFNDGIWNRLEQKVRYWAIKYDGIYVVTGGVLTDDLETIGRDDVAVPKYFYKVLLDNSRGDFKMIGFLVPSEDSDKPLYSFVVPVDEIEKMTGINFFPSLEDNLENQLEKNSDYMDWSFK
jgi:endonuclease G, mitochondrial